MPSHRVKNTAELRAKFEQAFAKSQTIQTGDGGLSKGELKKLERMGWVERVATSAKRKWLNVEPAKISVWRRR